MLEAWIRCCLRPENVALPDQVTDTPKKTRFASLDPLQTTPPNGLVVPLQVKQQATGVYEIRREVLWKFNQFGRARQSDETTQGTVLRQDLSSQAAATRAGFNRDGHTDKDMVLLGKNWTKTVKLFCLYGSHLVMRLEPSGSV